MRRSGSGALLGIAAIGVVVMASLVLTQGYLSGAINLTDAVITGRQAEYLADAAAREAYAKLQAQRNADPSMFLSGGGTSIEPTETRALAGAGVTIDPVQVTVTQGGDFHGDGRGTYGSVDLVAVARVPRRVARALGTSSYRSVKLAFEFKAVQQGAPAPFAGWPLYVTSLRGLPRVKDWYDTRIKGEWTRVREKTIEEVQKDADQMVAMISSYRDFIQRAYDYLKYAVDWPDMLQDPVGGQDVWNVTPDCQVGGFGPLDAELVDVRLRYDSNGDARIREPSLTGDRYNWHNNQPKIPAVRPELKARVESEIREKLGEYLGITDIQTALNELRSIAEKNPEDFYSVSETRPFVLADPAWREFRLDGRSLTSPAHVEEGVLRHEQLVLVPPAPPNYGTLSDPLLDIDPGWKRYDRAKWFDEFQAVFRPHWAAPFLLLPEKWEELMDPYVAAWTEKLESYEQLIKLDTAADENLLTYDYWARMAAYEFPDSGTMAGWIGSHGGRAAAVYRFPAGSVDLSGLPGDATFAAATGLTVQGSSEGVKNAVSGGSLTVGGAVRAALLAKAQAVEFGGATVTGTVATSGLRNAGAEELEPFTINHEDLSAGSVTVSICEYPTRVLLDRGE